MAKPRVFTSFDFHHDLTSKNLFCGQGKEQSPTPYMAEDWSSKDTLPQAQWEALIKIKVNQCNLLMVLVGKHMATAGGVAKEIRFAKDQDVPVVGIYVNGTDASSTLPVGLARGRTYAWTWVNVGKAIDLCMTEGKNKK